MSRQMDERNSPVLFDTTRVIDRNDDILGRAGLADSIAKALSDLAKDEKRLPCSVALFGPWGGGKTTVILWAIKSLRGEADNDADNDGEADKDVVPLYVSVKTCGGNLLLALLRALREKTNTKIRKIKGVFKNLAPILPALVGVFHSGLGTLAEKGLRSVKALLKKEPFEEFRSLLGKIAPDKTPIIFLDDLDRLPPLHAVEVLEQIELLLGITPTTEDEQRETEREKEPKREEEPESSKKHPKFILVVAVDPEILVMGLKSKYGERIFTDTHAHSYIAKHFQHRFSLQPPDPDTARKALSTLLDIEEGYLLFFLKPGLYVSDDENLSDSDKEKYKARNIKMSEIRAIFENMRFCKQAAEFARTHAGDPYPFAYFLNKNLEAFSGAAIQPSSDVLTAVKEEFARALSSTLRHSSANRAQPFTSFARVLVFLVRLLWLHANDIVEWFMRCPYQAWECISFHHSIWTRSLEPQAGRDLQREWDTMSSDDFSKCAAYAEQTEESLRESIKRRDLVRHLASAINIVSRGSWVLVRAALDTIAAATPKQKN